MEHLRRGWAWRGVCRPFPAHTFQHTLPRQGGPYPSCYVVLAPALRVAPRDHDRRHMVGRHLLAAGLCTASGCAALKGWKALAVGVVGRGGGWQGEAPCLSVTMEGEGGTRGAVHQGCAAANLVWVPSTPSRCALCSM
jgi:hypothetical protein